MTMPRGSSENSSVTAHLRPRALSAALASSTVRPWRSAGTVTFSGCSGCSGSSGVSSSVGSSVGSCVGVSSGSCGFGGVYVGNSPTGRFAAAVCMYDVHASTGHEPPVISSPTHLPNGVMSSCSPSGPDWYRPTTVARPGVNPANQADLLAVDVPVFPAAGRPMACAGLPEPSSTTWDSAYVVAAITSASNTGVRLSAPGAW